MQQENIIAVSVVSENGISKNDKPYTIHTYTLEDERIATSFDFVPLDTPLVVEMEYNERYSQYSFKARKEDKIKYTAPGGTKPAPTSQQSNFAASAEPTDAAAFNRGVAISAAVRYAAAISGYETPEKVFVLAERFRKYIEYKEPPKQQAPAMGMPKQEQPRPAAANVSRPQPQQGGNQLSDDLPF